MTYEPGRLTNPDATSAICSSCEHALTRHTSLGGNNYTCPICGPSSGTHHAGWREGLTEPRRSTEVRL